MNPASMRHCKWFMLGAFSGAGALHLGYKYHNSKKPFSNRTVTVDPNNGPNNRSNHGPNKSNDSDEQNNGWFPGIHVKLGDLRVDTGMNGISVTDGSETTPEPKKLSSKKSWWSDGFSTTVSDNDSVTAITTQECDFVFVDNGSNKTKRTCKDK